MTNSPSTEKGVHTPGPWTVVDQIPGHPPESGFVFISTLKPSGKDHWHGLAKVPRGWPGIADGISNAKLIAAAPELLEVAKDYLTMLWDERHSHMSLAEFDADQDVVKVRAALAKAGLSTTHSFDDRAHPPRRLPRRAQDAAR